MIKLLLFVIIVALDASAQPEYKCQDRTGRVDTTGSPFGTAAPGECAPCEDEGCASCSFYYKECTGCLRGYGPTRFLPCGGGDCFRYPEKCQKCAADCLDCPIKATECLEYVSSSPNAPSACPEKIVQPKSGAYQLAWGESVGYTKYCSENNEPGKTGLRHGSIFSARVEDGRCLNCFDATPYSNSNGGYEGFGARIPPFCELEDFARSVAANAFPDCPTNPAFVLNKACYYASGKFRWGDITLIFNGGCDGKGLEIAVQGKWRFITIDDYFDISDVDAEVVVEADYEAEYPTSLDQIPNWSWAFRASSVIPVSTLVPSPLPSPTPVVPNPSSPLSSPASKGGDTSAPNNDSTTPDNANISGNSSSKTNTASIVGGVVGGIACLGAIAAGLLIWQRRKKQASTENSSLPLSAIENGFKPATRPKDTLALSSLSSMRPSGDPVLQWIASQPHLAASASGAQSQRATSAPLSASLRALEFNWQDARIIKPLGLGSFGKVFLAELAHSPVALKLLVDARAAAVASVGPGGSGDNLSNEPAIASRNDLIDEVTLMSALRHPNVALLVGFCLSPPSLAMEYCTRGSVFDILQRASNDHTAAQELTWQRRVNMAADAAAGMLHLHTRRPVVLHRDMKSPNLLVATDWTVKVADMGMSKLVSEATQNSSTTAGGATNPRWVAPEVLNGQRHTEASDVFAFGVVMFEFLTWQLPWANTSVWTIVSSVQRGERPNIPPLHELPGFETNSSRDGVDRFVELMNQCWAQEAASRPNFGNIASTLRNLL